MCKFWSVVVMLGVMAVVVVGDTHTAERRMQRAVTTGDGKVEEMQDLTSSLQLVPQEISMIRGSNYTLELSLSHDLKDCLNVSLSMSEPVGYVEPERVTLCNGSIHVKVRSTTHGLATLTALVTEEDINLEAFCLVSVMYSEALTITADVLGWMYTIAWDISFLPQIIHNWRRKSVVGLSFDFLTFNFIGFLSYFIFNMGLLWIPEMQAQYSLRHPHTILHVRLNDVIFPMYALVCTAFQIFQCFVYKRSEGQRVSTACRVLSAALFVSAVVGCLLVPLVEVWWWLDVLYLLSYVKLLITAVKYVPQLWVNYKSSSTAGWSIYQVMLDFTGGSLSLLQMFLLAANYDDWFSILTDPAKLGLGLLSIIFNILFFIQHFCLYQHTSHEKQLMGVEGPIEDDYYKDNHKF